MTSQIIGNYVIYDPLNKGGFVDGQEAINSVPEGGTFFLAGEWLTSRDGKMNVHHAINIDGAGWRYEHGSSDFEDKMRGSRIVDNVNGPPAITMSPQTDTQGLKISNIAIRSQNPDDYAIKFINCASSLVDHVYIDCAADGKGGIDYAGRSQFTSARSVRISQFSEYGIKIKDTSSNNYSFYDVSVLSGKGKAGIFCTQGGLHVYHGQVECFNDDGDGAGILLYANRPDKPDMFASGALLQGVFAENSDYAVVIDGNERNWLGCNIIAPHWSLFEDDDGSRIRVRCGVKVKRGSHIVITSPQLLAYGNKGNIFEFDESATDCCFKDDTHNISGKFINNGTSNWIMSRW